MLTLQQMTGPDMPRPRLLAVQTILNFLRAGTDQPVLRGLDPNTEIQFNHAVVVWTFAHIVQRGIVSQDAMMSVVQMFPEELTAIGQTYADANLLDTDGKIEELPVSIIAVADRRYVSMTGLTGCFDLVECRVLPASPLTFEGVSYNIAAPVLMECMRIRREDHDGSQRPSKGRTYRSNDALHRTFGTGDGSLGSRRPTMGSGHNTDGAGGT